MTGEIGDIVNRIRSRVNTLHQELLDARSGNDLLKSENERLQASLLAGEMRVTKLEQQLADAQGQLEAQREQERQHIAEEHRKRDAAIDGLVKEIEHCIKQLESTHE